MCLLANLLHLWSIYPTLGVPIVIDTSGTEKVSGHAGFYSKNSGFHPKILRWRKFTKIKVFHRTTENNKATIFYIQLPTRFPIPQDWYAVELSNFAKTQFSHQKQRSWRDFDENFVPHSYYSSKNLNLFKVIIEVK